MYFILMAVTAGSNRLDYA